MELIWAFFRLESNVNPLTLIKYWKINEFLEINLFFNWWVVPKLDPSFGNNEHLISKK